MKTIKTFETFLLGKPLPKKDPKDIIEHDFNIGDFFIVKNKDSKFYNATGTISAMTTKENPKYPEVIVYLDYPLDFQTSCDDPTFELEKISREERKKLLK